MNRDYTQKLGLGTVQFGLDYGISNAAGKTTLDQVTQILECAQDHGITSIDTAHLYGDSEEALGETLTDKANFEIITKTIPLKKDVLMPEDIKIVKDGFELSLHRLKQDSVYGLLLHHTNDLKSENANLLYDYLCALRAEGKVQKIGISIYDAEQIDFVLNQYQFDLIQIPMNIFDQRLIASGSLMRLKEQDYEIHVRSAFLQGVVFMQPSELPEHLSAIAPYLQKFHTLVAHTNTTPAAAALAFLMENDCIDKVICGVNTPEQFKDLIDTVSALPILDKALFSDMAINDPMLVNPANWQR